MKTIWNNCRNEDDLVLITDLSSLICLSSVRHGNFLLLVSNSTWKGKMTSSYSSLDDSNDSNKRVGQHQTLKSKLCAFVTFLTLKALFLSNLTFLDQLREATCDCGMSDYFGSFARHHRAGETSTSQKPRDTPRWRRLEQFLYWSVQVIIQ